MLTTISKEIRLKKLKTDYNKHTLTLDNIIYISDIECFIYNNFNYDYLFRCVTLT
jgi:hypothetical protein